MSAVALLAGVTALAALLWAAAPEGPRQRRGATPISSAVPSATGAATASLGSEGVGPAARSLVTALDVARLMERLAAALRTGAAPRTAWAAVARSLDPGPLQGMAARMADGSEAGLVLERAAAGASSAPALRSLRAALEICARTGAPTASVLGSIATTLRDLHDARLARESAFAGPRATGRILLLLPVTGIALGTLIGVNPLRVLTTTPAGLAMLAAGITLTVTGWWWMHRMMRRAAGTPPAVDPSIVLELIAAPLLGGSPLADSLRCVGDALRPIPGAHDLAEDLTATASALSAGVPVGTACLRLPATLRPVREAALLAESSGADLAEGMRAAGADLRRGAAREAEAAAARLGVSLVLPTGLTLLPAFVVLGIIPTVTSLLGAAIGDATQW